MVIIYIITIPLWLQAERTFLQVQTERRELQTQVSMINAKIRDINAELDKVQRGEEKYLNLLTTEHQHLKEEKILEEDLTNHEQLERESFAFLSSAVRESHEKERARSDRTKYWSIIGSIIGAIIGILGTSINNYLRMREIRGIVHDSAEGGVELRTLVTTLSGNMQQQQKQVQSFINDLKGLVGATGSTAGRKPPSTPPAQSPVISTHASEEQIQKQSQDIINLMQKQDVALQKEMSDIKRILAVGHAKQEDGHVVYVGPEVKELLDKSESNIEWKLKMNALWTVTLVYGAIAVTIPILYGIFRGGGGS